MANENNTLRRRGIENPDASWRTSWRKHPPASQSCWSVDALRGKIKWRNANFLSEIITINKGNGKARTVPWPLRQTGVGLARPFTSFLALVSRSPLVYDISSFRFLSPSPLLPIAAATTRGKKMSPEESPSSPFFFFFLVRKDMY